MGGYREAMQEFYQKYRPLQKKYGLRTESRFGAGDNNEFKIWEHAGTPEERFVCWFKKEDSAEICYRKATGMLEIFKWREDERREMKAG